LTVLRDPGHALKPLQRYVKYIHLTCSRGEVFIEGAANSQVTCILRAGHGLFG
jgi:hypothetical protein